MEGGKKKIGDWTEERRRRREGRLERRKEKRGDWTEERRREGTEGEERSRK